MSIARPPTRRNAAETKRIAAVPREFAEDRIDAREAEAAWAKHTTNKTRLYTAEEARRKLRLIQE